MQAPMVRSKISGLCIADSNSESGYVRTTLIYSPEVYQVQQML